MKSKLSALRAAGAVTAFIAAASADPALAASTTTSTLDVSATVTSNCAVSTSPIDFGNVDVTLNQAVPGTGGISVTCTNGTAWTASADAGHGSGATFATRAMGDGNSNVLNYSLFTDPTHNNVWGDGSSSSVTIADTGTGTNQDKTIYGLIPASQTSVPAGSYADTVTVTVTY